MTVEITAAFDPRTPGVDCWDESRDARLPGIEVTSAAQRRRTPPLFAEYLARLARSVAASRRAV